MDRGKHDEVMDGGVKRSRNTLFLRAPTSDARVQDHQFLISGLPPGAFLGLS